MAKQVTRRAFLKATAIMASAVACSGPSIIRPPTAATTPMTVPSLDEMADGYVALAPRVLRTGQTESVSLALFRGDRPATSTVYISLVRDGRSVLDASARVAGRGMVPLPIPKLPEGEYQLQVSGMGFRDQAPIQVKDGTLILVETDKPIYKPGQTIHIRVLALDPTLRPATGEAVVEVMDAKGIKVFKKTTSIDEFGMATLELPLSTEPNLGVWKVRAETGNHSGQVDVRVERYVLPKYEVKVDLPRDWALVGEAIQGTVSAEYSFGKPVKGEAQIVASRYVGTWQEYARVTRPLEGKLAFDIPAVGYAVGSPAAGGMATVRLDVSVREQSTGYEEKSSRLVTIAARPVSLRMIPESSTFKPSLPFSLLLVSETPDKRPVDVDVQLKITYQNDRLASLRSEDRRVSTRNGLGRVDLTPPADAAVLTVQASASNAAGATTTLRSGYSPSGSFIHVQQVSQGTLRVGDTARFKVSATREAANFYYEVLSRGKVVFSDLSRSPDIAITLSPLMAPESRLLVYQLLANGEVAADYLPFRVEGSYPHQVQVSFDRDEVKPGDTVDVKVQTEGPARVGLAAVDRSVYILAENRLNLQQVFDELERLYISPQAELHEAEPIGPAAPPVQGRPAAPIAPAAPAAPVAVPHIPGAKETFQEAGVVVLTNRQVPAGKQLQQPRILMERAAAVAAPAAVPAARSTAGEKADTAEGAMRGEGLAEVQRVRQFFPETWIWAELATDASGRAVQRVTAPDSITTWMCRAVALSREKGLGIGEAQVRVFQPFFVQVDLPYSAIRGEELPVRVALYNYQPTVQEFTVDLEAADWFDLLDARTKSVTVAPNNVGSVAFTIHPRMLGVRSVKVTARSRLAADAIIKELTVEPEGVQREVVENLVLSPGALRQIDLSIPAMAVEGSARAYLALTGNVLSQTIEGLEELLRMPFGCGEQNMVLFAPNVFISRYLKETGQLKPEVMAKAEKMMLTGYQRELTYRRNDGSFSAFGQQDKEGSLWLTAFILKTFAQARELIFVDDSVLASGLEWVRARQKADGSFDPVGFVHHQELLGGLKGKTALTAYVAIALLEAGDNAAASKAVRYLEDRLDQTEEAYSVAIVTYALALGKSGRSQAARDKLMALARESDEGLFFGDEGPGGGPRPEPVPGGEGAEGAQGLPPRLPREPRPPAPGPRLGRSAIIETTGYATLALLQLGDRVNASRAVRWLASRRNAYGGFGSTQDTVVALQAMATAAIISRADVDATVALRAGNWSKDVRITPDNADVLHIVEVPAGAALAVEVRGKGQVMGQVVRRFNVLAAEEVARSVFQIDVRYSAEQVEVNDLITVTTIFRFAPPEPISAGMTVLDVAVPTGFAPVTESLDALVQGQGKLKRWDQAGRKVIFYIEDMLPGEQVTFAFQARALYPVRAQAVASQAYSYYRPEWRGESVGRQVVVAAGRT